MVTGRFSIRDRAESAIALPGVWVRVSVRVTVRVRVRVMVRG
jgi:hypothetical protein